MADATSASSIIIAAVTATPATIAALAAWRNSHQTRRQTKPSNGTMLAAIIEETRDDLREVKAGQRELKDDLRYHVQVQHGRGPLHDESRSG